ncbi:MAG: hypothetical protein M3O71_17030 [Bacteroidota bacterium]|nr:hypothetical protein [Bacteroidota bacterium]
MGTIKDFGRDFPKKAYTAAIYKALGTDLTNELAQANCKLTIDDDLINYSFTNLTFELQEKIDLKKKP